MTPFHQAEVPAEEVERVVSGMMQQFDARDPSLPTAWLGVSREAFEAQARQVVFDETRQRIYRNDVYQVNVRLVETRELGSIVHLSVKRIDRQPIHDWRDLQRIKNEIVGAECEAIELYPAESRLVDSANQYHLWCVPDPAFRWPVGFTERMVTDAPGIGAVQRKFAA